MEDQPIPSESIRTLSQRLLQPTPAERRRLLRIEAWIALGMVYILIAFAYACPQDYRKTSTAFVWTAWTAFMIRTFLFHLGILTLACAVVCGFYRKWRLAVAAVPAILVTTGPSALLYVPRGPSPVAADAITVMSVNLLMINQSTGAIVDEILAEQPDILLAQEYAPQWHEAFQKRITPALPYAQFVVRDDSFGTAIYSKFPFVGKVDMDLPLGQGAEPQVRAVVHVGDRDVAAYNIHLLPPWGIEYVTENRTQFADLLTLLEHEPLPCILAGDFNFTEASPNAARLRELGLRDAQDVAGWGRGATWPQNGFFRWIPGIRLDHIYVSHSIRCLTCRPGTGTGSDHRPVITRMELDAPQTIEQPAQ